MLKVEVDGRCVLYKQSVRDSDSQTIPHFVQGFIQQQHAPQPKWQPNIEFDYYVIGSMGMQSYFAHTERQKEQNEEESALQSSRVSKQAKCEQQKPATATAICRTGYSRFRELKNTARSGDMPKVNTVDSHISPKKNDKRNGISALSDKQNSTVDGSSCLPKPMGLLPGYSNKLKVERSQKTREVQRNHTVENAPLQSSPPIKLVRKPQPVRTETSTPLASRSANKQPTTSNTVPAQKEVVQVPKKPQQQEYSQPKSKKIMQPTFVSLTQTNKSSAPEAVIKKVVVSPNRPLTTGSGHTATKTKHEPFKKLPSAIDNPKIKELEESKVIRFRGSKPQTASRSAHSQPEAAPITNQPMSEHNSAPLADSETAPKQQSVSKDGIDLRLKHVSVFDDLTVEQGCLDMANPAPAAGLPQPESSDQFVMKKSQYSGSKKEQTSPMSKVAISDPEQPPSQPPSQPPLELIVGAKEEELFKERCSDAEDVRKTIWRQLKQVELPKEPVNNRPVLDCPLEPQASIQSKTMHEVSAQEQPYLQPAAIKQIDETIALVRTLQVNSQEIEAPENVAPTEDPLVQQTVGLTGQVDYEDQTSVFPPAETNQVSKSEGEETQQSFIRTINLQAKPEQTDKALTIFEPESKQDSLSDRKPLFGHVQATLKIIPHGQMHKQEDEVEVPNMKQGGLSSKIINSNASCTAKALIHRQTTEQQHTHTIKQGKSSSPDFGEGQNRAPCSIEQSDASPVSTHDAQPQSNTPKLQGNPNLAGQPLDLLNRSIASYSKEANIPDSKSSLQSQTLPNPEPAEEGIAYDRFEEKFANQGNNDTNAVAQACENPSVGQLLSPEEGPQKNNQQAVQPPPSSKNVEISSSLGLESKTFHGCSNRSMKRVYYQPPLEELAEASSDKLLSQPRYGSSKGKIYSDNGKQAALQQQGLANLVTGQEDYTSERSGLVSTANQLISDERVTFQKQELGAPPVLKQPSEIATYKTLTDDMLPSKTSIMNRYRHMTGSCSARASLLQSSEQLQTVRVHESNDMVEENEKRWSYDDSGKAFEELYGYCLRNSQHYDYVEGGEESSQVSNKTKSSKHCMPEEGSEYSATRGLIERPFAQAENAAINVGSQDGEVSEIQPQKVQNITDAVERSDLQERRAITGSNEQPSNRSSQDNIESVIQEPKVNMLGSDFKECTQNVEPIPNSELEHEARQEESVLEASLDPISQTNLKSQGPCRSRVFEPETQNQASCIQQAQQISNAAIQSRKSKQEVLKEELGGAIGYKPSEQSPNRPTQINGDENSAQPAASNGDAHTGEHKQTINHTQQALISQHKVCQQTVGEAPHPSATKMWQSVDGKYASDSSNVGKASPEQQLDTASKAEQQDQAQARRCARKQEHKESVSESSAPEDTTPVVPQVDLPQRIGGDIPSQTAQQEQLQIIPRPSLPTSRRTMDQQAIQADAEEEDKTAVQQCLRDHSTPPQVLASITNLHESNLGAANNIPMNISPQSIQHETSALTDTPSSDPIPTYTPSSALRPEVNEEATNYEQSLGRQREASLESNPTIDKPPNPDEQHSVSPQDPPANNYPVISSDRWLKQVPQKGASRNHVEEPVDPPNNQHSSHEALPSKGQQVQATLPVTQHQLDEQQTRKDPAQLEQSSTAAYPAAATLHVECARQQKELGMNNSKNLLVAMSRETPEEQAEQVRTSVEEDVEIPQYKPGEAVRSESKINQNLLGQGVKCEHSSELIERIAKIDEPIQQPAANIGEAQTAGASFETTPTPQQQVPEAQDKAPTASPASNPDTQKEAQIQPTYQQTQAKSPSLHQPSGNTVETGSIGIPAQQHPDSMNNTSTIEHERIDSSLGDCPTAAATKMDTGEEARRAQQYNSKVGPQPTPKLQSLSDLPNPLETKTIKDVSRPIEAPSENHDADRGVLDKQIAQQINQDSHSPNTWLGKPQPQQYNQQNQNLQFQPQPDIFESAHVSDDKKESNLELPYPQQQPTSSFPLESSSKELNEDVSMEKLPCPSAEQSSRIEEKAAPVVIFDGVDQFASKKPEPTTNARPAVEQENSDTTKQLEGSINTDGPLRKQDATQQQDNPSITKDNEIQKTEVQIGTVSAHQPINVEPTLSEQAESNTPCEKLNHQQSEVLTTQPIQQTITSNKQTSTGQVHVVQSKTDLIDKQQQETPLLPSNINQVPSAQAGKSMEQHDTPKKALGMSSSGALQVDHASNALDQQQTEEPQLRGIIYNQDAAQNALIHLEAQSPLSGVMSSECQLPRSVEPFDRQASSSNKQVDPIYTQTNLAPATVEQVGSESNIIQNSSVAASPLSIDDSLDHQPASWQYSSQAQQPNEHTLIITKANNLEVKPFEQKLTDRQQDQQEQSCRRQPYLRDAMVPEEPLPSLQTSPLPEKHRESSTYQAARRPSQQKLATQPITDESKRSSSRNRIKAATDYLPNCRRPFTPRILVQSAKSIDCAIQQGYLTTEIPKPVGSTCIQKKLRLKRSLDLNGQQPDTAERQHPIAQQEISEITRYNKEKVETKEVACSATVIKEEEQQLSNKVLGNPPTNFDTGPRRPSRGDNQRLSTEQSHYEQKAVQQHESTRLSDTLINSTNNFARHSGAVATERNSQQPPRERIIQEESEDASSQRPQTQHQHQQPSQQKSNEPVIIIINSGANYQSPSQTDPQAIKHYAAAMAQQQFVVNHHSPANQDAFGRVSIKDSSSNRPSVRRSTKKEQKKPEPPLSRKTVLQNLDISEILNATNEAPPVSTHNQDNIQPIAEQEEVVPRCNIPKRTLISRGQAELRQLTDQLISRKDAQQRTSMHRPSLEVGESPSRQLRSSVPRPLNIFEQESHIENSSEPITGKPPAVRAIKEAQIHRRILTKSSIERFEQTTPTVHHHPFTMVDAKGMTFPNEFNCSIKDENLNRFGANPSFSYTVNLINSLSSDFLPGLFRDYPIIGSSNTNYLWKGSWKTVKSDSLVPIVSKDLAKQSESLMACFIEKGIYLYERKHGSGECESVDDYFQTITGCPVLRFLLDDLTPERIWAMLTELTQTKKPSQGTYDLILAVPGNREDLPFTVSKIEEYKGNKLVQLKSCNSTSPVLMEFQRFCKAFTRVSVGYFNPNFLYSSLSIEVASHIVSFEIVAADTTAVYLWLHQDTPLLPYKLCLYLEFEPKKYRFIGEKPFRKAGRLFNTTIRGKYMLILEHKAPVKSNHTLCCCSLKPIEVKLQSNEFERTKTGGYENQGVVLLPVQMNR